MRPLDCIARSDIGGSGKCSGHAVRRRMTFSEDQFAELNITYFSLDAAHTRLAFPFVRIVLQRQLSSQDLVESANLTVTINGNFVGYADIGEDVLSLAPSVPGGRRLGPGPPPEYYFYNGLSLTSFTLLQPQTAANDMILNMFGSAVGIIESNASTANTSVEGPIYDAENIARWYVSIQIIQNRTGIYIEAYARHVCYNAKITQAYFGPLMLIDTIYFNLTQYQGTDANPITVETQPDKCFTYSKGTTAPPGFPIHLHPPGVGRRLSTSSKQRELGISELDCITKVVADVGQYNMDRNPFMNFMAKFNHTGAPNCHGEPHFVTWQGKRFDFHGECDLVYLHVPEFRGLGLSIHLRTLIRGEFSFVDVAALQIGSDILELGSHKGKFLLNGKLADPAKDNTIAGFPISYTQDPAKKLPSVTLDVELGEGEIIRFRQLRNIVSVYIVGPKKDDFEAGVGLVGSFLTGSMLARDGQTVMADPNAFGQEWQVLDTDPQLFQVIRAPQYPQKCTMPSVVAEESRRRRLEAGLTDEEAQLACAGLSEDAYNDCMYDVIMSGDVRLAEAYVY